MNEKIKIKKIVDWDIALESALFTVNKPYTGKIPSNKWKAKICLSEHSMLADIRYIVEMFDVECWSSQHIARHDAFAGHTIRESKEIHYVGTSRTDITGIDRKKLYQDAPVAHRINLSAKDFITLSKLRLCKKASYETRVKWGEVVKELSKIDPVTASKCVPNCIYRGRCPETDGSCGYDKTEKFKTELENYWNEYIN